MSNQPTDRSAAPRVHRPSLAARTGITVGTVLALFLAGALPLTAGTVDSLFERGDANLDEFLNIADPVSLLEFLFSGGDAPACEDAADANDDGQLNIGDAVHLLTHLFSDGPEPPPPFGVPGSDPTADALGCSELPCLDASEILQIIGLSASDVGDVGLIPGGSQSLIGIATVSWPTAQVTINASQSSYNAVNHSFFVAGTGSLVPFTVTIDPILLPSFGCTVSGSVNWTLNGQLATAPYAPGAVQLTGVQSIGSNVTNPNVNVCSGLVSAVANFIVGQFESQLLGVVAGLVDDLETEVVVTANSILSEELVLACEPQP